MIKIKLTKKQTEAFTQGSLEYLTLTRNRPALVFSDRGVCLKVVKAW